MTPQVINAQILPLRTLADTTNICLGDSVLLKFSEELISKNATYTWQTPNAIIVHAKQLYVKHKGLYIVKINDGKKYWADTTYVRIIDKPKHLRIRDTTFCGNPIDITLASKEYKYTWSNGDIGNKTQLDKAGKYWVKINHKGCVIVDTFKVSTAGAITPNFGKEILMCETDLPKTLSVKASADVKFYWNTGSTASSINVAKEGVYWVKSSSKNCGTRTDSVTIKYKNCDCDIYIPNSFSPNDDDKNDEFALSFQCEYSYFLITIYDRWGNVVFTSKNITSKWNGKFKGIPCPDDVYIYKIEAIQKGNDKKIIKNGHVSLFR